MIARLVVLDGIHGSDVLVPCAVSKHEHAWITIWFGKGRVVPKKVIILNEEDDVVILSVVPEGRAPQNHAAGKRLQPQEHLHGPVIPRSQRRWELLSRSTGKLEQRIPNKTAFRRCRECLRVQNGACQRRFCQSRMKNTMSIVEDTTYHWTFELSFQLRKTWIRNVVTSRRRTTRRISTAFHVTNFNDFQIIPLHTFDLYRVIQAKLSFKHES